jgi:CHRD domain
MTLRYTLVAVGLTSQPLFAHIHSPAPRGANAGVVTFRTPPQNANAVCVRFTPLALQCHGVITAANLQGSLAGQPLSALLDRMVAGQTYTNVHTALPGGFPSGEVRGQNDVTVNVTR